MLHRIEARGIDGDELDIGRLEHGPGAGGEILQPRADGEHDIGLGGQRIGRGGADDAQRPGIHGMLMAEHPAPGDGLGHGDAVLGGEGGEALARPGIMHPAAGQDQRPLRLAQQSKRRGDLAPVGALPADLVVPRLEEALGIVIGLALRVLAEGEEGWARNRPGPAWWRPPEAGSPGSAPAGRCGPNIGSPP